MARSSGNLVGEILAAPLREMTTRWATRVARPGIDDPARICSILSMAQACLSWVFVISSGSRIANKERFMARWLQVRRVVIIVDTVIEAAVMDGITKAGAGGYNCIHCFGKGRHEALEAVFTGKSRARIETLVREEVAEAIMDFVHESEFRAYPITAYMDIVEVDPRDENLF
jgi:hypothetical protein